MAYACVRTDNMSGTVNGKDLVSLKYMPNNKEAKIENGSVVVVGAYLDGEREVRVATDTLANSKVSECALIASEEVVKAKAHNNLDEFINIEGDIIRGYRFTSRDVFSITEEAFVEGSSLKVGSTVELIAGNKMKAVETATGESATVVGKIVLVEGDWYVVEVA